MEATPKPKLFYGYYIVAACFIILFMLWGMVLNTFPIFLKPISENMGWSRGALSYALLMGAIGIIFSAPIAGKLMDRFGAKPVMTAGTLIVGVGLMAGSRITHLWQIYVVFAFIGAGLMCSAVIPCSLVISNWFVSRRGMVMGIAFAGTSIGGAIMSLVANWIIIDYGWRTAFLFSGITVLVVVIPVILFLIRTHPSECGLKPYRRSDHHSEASADNWGVSVKKALSLRVFWQIGGIMFIVSFVQGGLGNHCVAYLTDIGHSQTQAATAWSLVMWVMVLGKLALGPFADRCGAKNAMASACALLGVSIALVLFAESYWIVIAFASIYGFACGAPLTLNPLLTAGNLGMKNFGAIYGILNVLSTVGGAIGPVIAGEVFDKRGTYQPIFIVFIGLIAVAGLLAVTMKSSPRPATLTEPVRSGGAVD